ncbi:MULTISPECIES: ATP phosphoribosyltransferase [Reinekea]|jgi:ATP phosphoribosyltransferase|uniref:ATP phosphoribosyltransferase n=1 Tax=Reinekea forsetii TaxID=1336806 RepID=A0A2K8KYE0_9GAMM|nr:MULTISPECIES: ATP phosphoribosyltransferase [Reinekea]ATX77506.1 ATP phosphoribosyltransferase [Reinekea forsetii]MDO7641238.1 ATP phosphoribosyltransferase [Reinekea forsetii]MDO7644513.1 ATP phosphoribosyltransferase [Reinekea forsetii]
MQRSAESITIALSKGRILKETLPLFAAAGIEPLEDVHTSRKLIFETTQPNVYFIIIRAVDVPTYVEYGVADLGVSGKDVLMEHGAEEMYELLDLNIAKCQLMTAKMKDVALPAGRLKVATKYINVARRYFADQGRQVDLIKLYGGMELAPIMNLADVIVDIVDTGNTLKANGLAPDEFIADISSRLVASRLALKMKDETIKPLVALLAAAIKRNSEQA